MTSDANNEPKRLQPSTMDAWLMLCVALGLYVVSQLLVQLLIIKVSLLGGSAAGQVLFFLVPSLLYAKWKSGAVKEALRLRRVAGEITWRIALLSLTFIGLSDLLQQATQSVIARHFGDFLSAQEAFMEFLTPKSAAGLFGNIVLVGLIPPVCEEVLFRGAFQGTLEQRGPVRAILASTLVFAFVHLSPMHR